MDESVCSVEIITHQSCNHPREVIKGDVKMKIFKPIVIMHIFIEISGVAECSWDEPSKNWFRRTPIQFQGQHTFFFCKHSLVGNEGNEVTLEKRNYYFAFKCKLPGHLPSTWHGELGEIKYIASVTISDVKGVLGVFTKELKIVPYRNISFEEHLQLQVKTEVTRKFRFGLLNLGTVTASLWLPFSGIAAGQCLPVICRIENNSSVLFGGIIFILTQIQIYRSEKPYYAEKTIRKDVCRVARLTDIFRGNQEFFCVLKTACDTFPTAQFWRCSTCQLIYEVWVQIQGALPSNNAYGYTNIDLPGTAIIIGTHPAIIWDINTVSGNVMKTLLRPEEAIEIDPPPPVEVVQEILNFIDDDFSAEMLSNKQFESDNDLQPRRSDSAIV